MRVVVELRDVRKSFGRRHVLRGLELVLESGEIVGLLGPNGSGKTTSLRIIAGFLPPDSGDVRICGAAIEDDPRGARRRIGYVPERPPLYDPLTVAEYLSFIAAAKGIAHGQRRPAIDTALDAFELGAVRRQVIGRLSKGYRQRVALAQATLGDPEILLLDEAMNGLDPLQIIEARRFIRRGAAGRTTIFSSHVMQEVAALSTRVIVIHDGRAMTIDQPEPDAAGDTIEVEMEGIGLEAALALLTDVPGVVRADARPTGTGVLLRLCAEPGADIRAEAARRAAAAARLLALRPVAASLEDRFIAAIASSHAEAQGGG